MSCVASLVLSTITSSSSSTDRRTVTASGAKIATWKSWKKCLLTNRKMQPTRLRSPRSLKKTTARYGRDLSPCLAAPAIRLRSLLVLPPLAAGIISLEQVRRRFCVGFAMAGLRNFGALGDEERIVDPDARRADRRAALVMIAYGAAIAGLIAVVLVALPI